MGRRKRVIQLHKDNTRDYATEAFRTYAELGKPTFDEAREQIYRDAAKRGGEIDPEEAVKKSMPLLLDIDAVDKTLLTLARERKDYIISAIEDVYFVTPFLPLKKGEITERVRRSSVVRYAGERTVYLWLREARQIFAEIRGLRR